MITQTKFYKKNKEEIVGSLIVGLAWGIGGGLAWSIAVGFAWGLAWGLAVGLAWGLAVGLVVGLAMGLVVGLAWGLAVILVNWTSAFPFLTNFKSTIFLVLGLIILIELFYWLDKEKPKKKLKLSFVLKKKFEATCEVLLGFSLISQIYLFIREGSKYLTKEVINEVIKWIGYIGVGIIGIALFVVVIYLWLQLNKLKYRK